MILCEYGCGNKAQYQFKNGKWCCSESPNQCSGKIVIPWNKNKKGCFTLDTIKQMKKSHLKIWTE